MTSINQPNSNLSFLSHAGESGLACESGEIKIEIVPDSQVEGALTVKRFRTDLKKNQVSKISNIRVGERLFVSAADVEDLTEIRRMFASYLDTLKQSTIEESMVLSLPHREMITESKPLEQLVDELNNCDSSFQQSQIVSKIEDTTKQNQNQITPKIIDKNSTDKQSSKIFTFRNLPKCEPEVKPTHKIEAYKTYQTEPIEEVSESQNSDNSRNLHSPRFVQSFEILKNSWNFVIERLSLKVGKRYFDDYAIMILEQFQISKTDIGKQLRESQRMVTSPFQFLLSDSLAQIEMCFRQIKSSIGAEIEGSKKGNQNKWRTQVLGVVKVNEEGVNEETRRLANNCEKKYLDQKLEILNLEEENRIMVIGYCYFDLLLYLLNICLAANTLTTDNSRDY